MDNKETVKKDFFVSVSPHIRHRKSVDKIMLLVLAGLFPAAIGACYFFGGRALAHMVTAVVFAVAAEAGIQKFRKVPVTISDLSAAVTGLLVAFNIPSAAPFWISAVGSIFAMAVVKHPFGGLGQNFMNPALGARAFLLAAWPVHMTAGWLAPRNGFVGGLDVSGVDGISAATPLALMKNYVRTGAVDVSRLSEAIPDLFLGNVGGCIGETSALLLLIGAAPLIFIGIIRLRVPLAYISTVFVLTWIFNGTGCLFSKDALIVPVFHIFSGGLMLGALFMATDMVTMPITPVGQLIFGISCGVITVMIRLVGGYPEGVSYSIILMNIAVPLLDRIRRPRKYGFVKEKNE